jgi:hypothetical protein
MLSNTEYEDAAGSREEHVVVIRLVILLGLEPLVEPML